jgi:hypothetical protein
VTDPAGSIDGAEHRTADEAAPLAGRIVVHECDLVRGKPRKTTSAKDVRDNLPVTAGPNDQDHRALPMNSRAVA